MIHHRFRAFACQAQGTHSQLLPAGGLAAAWPQGNQRNFRWHSHPHRKTRPQTGAAGHIERHVCNLVPTPDKAPVRLLHDPVHADALAAMRVAGELQVDAGPGIATGA